ncbi:neuropeptide F receptor-like isoform X2 [Tetranychus urticae]|nr:neuropeptide F receptor-like isoform X2 [Tetranychus urticae]
MIDIKLIPLQLLLHLIMSLGNCQQPTQQQQQQQPHQLDDPRYEILYHNMSEIMQKLQTYVANRAIDDTSFTYLMIAYIILIILGATGNGLVCMVVIRKPSMRTPRNVFIINLAISDLLLCLFTMPFSLVEIVLKFWPLGEATCKLVAGLQATSIFVSTISITAIALDRYKVIVNPNCEPCHPINTFITLSAIWITALALSAPLFIYRTVESHSINILWLKSIDYCIEKWPIEHGRALYSIFSMIFQYVCPCIIVTVAYIRILRKLNYRMVQKKMGTTLAEKQRREKIKQRKTRLLLISISFIFGISWLPLNIVNIVADIYFPFDNSQVYRILFACCHLAGMSSACSNPLLYGFLNDNFRREFRELFIRCCPFLVTSTSTYTDNEDRVDSMCLQTYTREPISSRQDPER